MVGGTVIQIDMVEVFSPWIGLASLVGIATLAITKKWKLDKGCRDS